MIIYDYILYGVFLEFHEFHICEMRFSHFLIKYAQPFQFDLHCCAQRQRLIQLAE